MKIKFARITSLIVILFALAIFIAPKPARAATCTSAVTGLWSASATWVAGCTGAGGIPGSTDDVVIANGHVVTFDLASATVNTLTVNAGGTASSLTISGSNSLTITGNASVNSDTNGITKQIAVGSGTLSIGGNLTLTGGSSTRRADLTIGTGTVTVSGNVAPSGSNARMIFTGSGTLKIGGNYPTGGTLTTFSGSTIEYNGSGAQNIGSYTYENLSTSGSGTKTLFDGPVTVNGILTIGSGTTLDESTRTMTLPGGATLIVNGTLDFTDTAGLIQSGTSGTTTLTMGVSGLIRTLDSAGLGPATGASLQTQTGGGWDTSSLDTKGTVEYYRSLTSAQTVTDRNYNNLIIGGTGQNKTWTLGAERTVTGTLTISNTATSTLAGAFTLNVNGDWTHTSSGTFTHSAGTVNFLRNGTSTLSRTTGSGLAETFCNLTISANTLLDTTDDFIAVSAAAGCGTRVTNGLFRREAPSQDINALGTTFIFTDSLNMPTVILTQTAGTLMSGTSVTVTGHYTQTYPGFPCGATTLGAQPVLRLFDIAPTNTSNVTATLRLQWRTTSPYAETNGVPLSSAILYHCVNGNWTRYTSGTYAYGTITSGSETYQFVQLAGLTSFSPFAISGPSAPTAVTLSNFSARSADAGVALVWKTGSEIKTAGFNIYRAENPAGPYTRLNAQLIPGSGDALRGGAYEFHDASALPDHAYYYQLEDVELNGASVRHTPIVVRIPGTSAREDWSWVTAFGIVAVTSLAAFFIAIKRRA